MREIKFRVWDKDIPKNEGELDNPTGMMVEWNYVIKSNYLYEALIGNHPIMQFTGLKDKNGKEIYEGDQLHICPGYMSTVEFIDGCFMSVYKHPEDGETIPLNEIVDKETIIIGNIYQTQIR